MTIHMHTESHDPILLDCDHALNHVGGDPELLVHLCRVFLCELPVRVEELQANIAGRDYNRAGRALLQLQSCILVFGAGHASCTAEKLEFAIRNRRFRQMRSEWMCLQTQLQLLIPQVQRLLLEMATPHYAIQ